MRKRTLQTFRGALIALALIADDSAFAGYSPFYSVGWIRTADIGWIAFRNESNTVLGDPICPNAVEVLWNIDSKSDYYKRVFTILLTAKTTGGQVRFWNCGCSADGTQIGACDIELK